jgi:hypothetical protein
MAFNFPNTPVIGDVVAVGNTKRKRSAKGWSIVTGAVVSSTTQSDNGVIDLSSGSYHKILLNSDNASITTSFANIAPGSSKWTVEFNMEFYPDGFNITSNPSNVITNWRAPSSFTNVLFNIYPSNVYDFFCISPDGRKVAGGAYIGTANYIFRIATLSTPFDVTTASVTYQSGNVHSSMGGGSRSDSLGIRGNAFFKDNNTIHVGTRYINASTGSISTSTTGQVPDRGQSAVANGNWTSDGLKFYTLTHLQNAVPIIHYYQASIAFAPSSLSLVRSTTITQANNTATTQSGDKAVWMSDDGLSMFYGGTYISNNYSSTMIMRYNLSTAFDVTTAVYSNQTYLTTAGAVQYGKFVDGGDKFFHPSNNGFTKVANLTIPAGVPTLIWPASVIWKENTTPTISSNQTLILEFYSPDGGTTIYGIESINRDNT